MLWELLLVSSVDMVTPLMGLILLLALLMVGPTLNLIVQVRYYFFVVLIFYKVADIALTDFLFVHDFAIFATCKICHTQCGSQPFTVCPLLETLSSSGPLLSSFFFFFSVFLS